MALLAKKEQYTFVSFERRIAEIDTSAYGCKAFEEGFKFLVELYHSAMVDSLLNDPHP